MKKLFSTAIFLWVSHAACVPFSGAMKQAENAFEQYATTKPKVQQAKDLIKYMQYYQSFYSPVTPPPAELRTQIIENKKNKAARRYVDTLENIVKEHGFYIAPSERTRIGQLGLTDQGKELYEQSIALLEKRFFKKDQCCGELGQMIDRMKEKRF